jgi:hypothetical protein
MALDSADENASLLRSFLRELVKNTIDQIVIDALKQQTDMAAIGDVLEEQTDMAAVD